ncbi:MAG: T9SS type A sorting domain-containing protein [Ignavibacteriaceae bacterium]|nr:T9SS type A sorting domain-containing protein [Ignavibacteriaceae bacterium]
MIFDEPGVYRFNAEIQSCTNSGSNLFTNFTANGAEGCDTEVHNDYAASTCNSPASLFSDDIFITICDQNSISFLSGSTMYCPSEELYLVYSIGADDDAVDLSLLPNWIVASVDNAANTVTLLGTVPSYDAENPTISFDVRSICSYNPESCPGAVVNQTITVVNAQTPVLNGSNFTCVGESVNIGSDVAGTWYNSNSEIISIEQTAPDNEVVVTALSAGSTVINCEITDNGCQVLSEDFIFTVNPDYEINIIDAICDGDVYIFGEDELDEEGEYTLNTTSMFGCDSVVYLDLSVLPIVEHEFSATGETYTWNETTYTESGDYTQTFLAANGCDSIVTLHLTIITDIASPNVKGNITVFPNPANSVVFVDAISLKDQIVTVNVTDISGKIIIQQLKLSSDNSISIAELSDGIYFLNVFFDDKLVATKTINKSK